MREQTKFASMYPPDIPVILGKCSLKAEEITETHSICLGTHSGLTQVNGKNGM